MNISHFDNFIARDIFVDHIENEDSYTPFSQFGYSPFASSARAQSEFRPIRRARNGRDAQDV